MEQPSCLLEFYLIFIIFLLFGAILANVSARNPSKKEILNLIEIIPVKKKKKVKYKNVKSQNKLCELGKLKYSQK